MAHITILGNAIEGNTDDSYHLTLHTDSSTWNAGELGGTSKIFKKKSGSYVFKTVPERGTALLVDDAFVAFLTSLEPSSAQPNQSGRGRNNETARKINWKIESI